jgi:hypothetical protein
MDAFTGVDLALDADAVVTIGDKYSIKVEGPKDVLPKIEVGVVGGKLELGMVPNEIITGKPNIRIAIVAPKLDAVKASFGRLQVPKLTGDAVHVEAGVVGTVQVDQVVAKQLTVKLGPNGSVSLSGQADTVTVEGGTGKAATLKGAFQQVTANATGTVKMQVSGTVPALTATVGGSSSFEASGDLGNTAVTVEGGGTATVSGKLGALSATLTGSGRLKASGTAAMLHVEADGGSKLTAEQLQAETATVTAKSGAECTVWAKMLMAMAANSGVIRYKGSPQLDRRVSQSGEVAPLGK